MKPAINMHLAPPAFARKREYVLAVKRSLARGFTARGGRLDRIEVSAATHPAYPEKGTAIKFVGHGELP